MGRIPKAKARHESEAALSWCWASCRLWLIEAAAGTTKICIKMAQAVLLSKVFGAAEDSRSRERHLVTPAVQQSREHELVSYHCRWGLTLASRAPLSCQNCAWSVAPVPCHHDLETGPGACVQV